MEFQMEPVHVGSAIEQRRLELGISKAEFARRINVSQQHVNRILERDTMETNKLLLVSQALEFNFFQLFHSSEDEKFTGKNTAVAYGGGFNYAHVGDKITNGDAALAELKLSSLDKLLKSEKAHSAALQNTLESKDMVISMLKEKIAILEEKINMMKQEQE